MNPSDTLRAVISGEAAVGGEVAAAVLHEVGGKAFLSEVAQRVVRVGVMDAAGTLAVTAGSGLASRVATGAVDTIARQGGRAAVRGAARTLGGRALGAGVLGGAADGLVALWDGVRGVRAGHMTPRQAGALVARETATGGLASAGGMLFAALVVTATGPVGATAMFVIAAGGSVGAKAALRGLVG